jgi:hypothetical protein
VTETLPQGALVRVRAIPGQLPGLPSTWGSIRESRNPATAVTAQEIGRDALVRLFRDLLEALDDPTQSQRTESAEHLIVG